jgi:hypothetical protein
MSDPTRIRDAGSEEPEELRELFRSAAKPEPFTSATHAALSRRIAVIAAAPIPLFFPLLAKALPWLLGAAVVTAGTLIMRAGGGEPERRAASVAKPTVTVSAPPVSAQPPARPPALAAVPVEPRAKVAAPASPSDDDALAGETQLLLEAQRALATDPRNAIAIAREHARRYPRGQLVAERELLMVQALVELGRTREAEARGRELRKASPNSIYQERLDKVLRGR